MFILNLFFLLLNSFLLAGLFGSLCWIEFFVLLITFFYSQLLGISIILGILKLLYDKYLLIFSIFLFLLILPNVKKVKLPEFTQLTLNFSNFILTFLLSLTLSIHILYILNLLILPPLTTDGLLYHLPFAVHYYKTGSITLPNLFFTDIAMTYYPIGGEIFYFFSILSQKEFLFKFTQFPFLILGCFSLFLLMKSMKFSDFLSINGSLIFSLIKPVLKESSMCFVDLIMASVFISTIFFFQQKEKKYIVPGILSLSILLSIKTLSIIFGILILPFLFFKKKGKLSISFYFSLIFLIFFGLFSYLRNFILTGNPVYPAEISIGKFILFKGAYVYPKILFFEKIKTLLHVIAFSSLQIDPSPFLKIFFFIFFVISLILSLKEKEKKFFLLFLIVPFSILFYCFLIPPHYYQIRHFMPIYGILVISLIYPFKFHKLELFCIPVFMYFFVSALPSILLLNFLYYFPLCLIFVTGWHFKKTIFTLLTYFTGSLWFLILFSQNLYRTSYSYTEAKFALWKAFYKEEGNLWEFIQRESGKGKNIAYIGGFLIYPFYGHNLQNNVYYQSVNSIETLPVYKYQEKEKFPEGDIENIYRKNPSFQLWYNGLKKKNIDWIIIKKDKKYIEKEWIEKYPDLFKTIYISDIAEIYTMY